MKRLNFLGLILCMVVARNASAYRVESGELYLNGGFGVNLNVARMEKPSKTPGAELPLLGGVDYLIDNNWGAFATLIPSFGVGNIGIGVRAGAKYWLTQFDWPVLPYASLAVTPGFLIPFNGANHFTIGVAPGFGVNYFVVAKFMVGVHVHMNPSFAFAGGEKKFEFAVMPFFDVSLRI